MTSVPCLLLVDLADVPLLLPNDPGLVVPHALLDDEVLGDTLGLSGDSAVGALGSTLRNFMESLALGAIAFERLEG